MECVNLLLIFVIVYMVCKGYCASYILLVSLFSIVILFSNLRKEGFSPCPSTSPNCRPSPSPSPSPSLSPMPPTNWLNDILGFDMMGFLTNKYTIGFGVVAIFIVVLLLMMSGGNDARLPAGMPFAQFIIR